jgi:gamma-glutamyltranspeptidase/glutathione hydrolase
MLSQRGCEKKLWVNILMVVIIFSSMVLVSAEPATAVTRPIIMGRNGMVCSNNPLASQVGMRILQQGGNAIDAAVAVASAVTLFEPAWSNPGGMGFMLVYLAETKELKALNYTGKAPYAAKQEMYTKENIGVSHAAEGPMAPLAPGSFGGWAEALKEHGTMSLAQVLQPTIEYAEQGIPISYFFTDRYYDVAKSMSIYPNWAKIFYPNGRLLKPEEVYDRKDLAATFRKITDAEEKSRFLGRKKAIQAGRDVLYKGEIAKTIAKYYKENGGIIAEKDLAEYEAVWVKPISTTYRGYEVYTIPPNSSGITFLEELNIMEGFDVKALGHNTPEYIHLLTEAIKLGRADRVRYIADPDFVRIPVEGLLSKKYAEKQRARIDPNKASQYTPGAPEEYKGTTQITVADKYGNLVSLTQTGGYENEIIADTGITLYGMRWFDLDPKSVNRIEPGKRPRFNMSPSIVFKDGKPFMAFGTPGGESIWQHMPQMLINIIDFGMNIQEAIEAPRFYSQLPMTLQLEKRIPAAVQKALEAKGHKIILAEEWSLGAMNGIIINQENHFYMGGADPRREGYVVAW